LNFYGESSGESKKIRNATFATKPMKLLAKVVAKVIWRKCESNMTKPLISLGAKARPFPHTTYGGSLAANTPLRIGTGGRHG
jgi:hypothetical protein